MQALPETLRWLLAWRRAAAKSYRYQYGLYLALPLVWGCLEAFVLPWYSTAGYLATALFLERRPGRRLPWQALLFTAWSLWLGQAYRLPDTFDVDGRARLQTAGGIPGVAGGRARLEGIVSGFPALSPLGWTFTLKTKTETWRVQAQSDFSLRPGQMLAVTGKETPPLPPTNPGQFDYPAYLASQGIDGVFRAGETHLLQGPGPLDRLIALCHDGLQAGLQRTIPAENLALLTAMLLGETGGLDDSVTDDFRASGMLHILAISGQHVGILALILLQVFSLLRLPRKGSFLAAAALLALYVPISGGSVSVIRSALMFWCTLPSVLCERPALTLNNLGWAAALCLLFMPRQILALGCQLSFAATFFLILYSRPMSAWLTRRRIRHPIVVYLVSTPLLSLAIFLGLWPLLAATVHTLAPSSLIGNLATVGLSSGMLVAACLALMAYPILPPLGLWFGAGAGAFASWLTTAVHALARAPGSNLSVASLSPPWSLLLLGLLLAFPFALRTRKGRVLALAGVCLFSLRWAGLAAWDAWRRPTCVAFLDVGQGDGAVIDLPGAAILIDAGPVGAGEKFILPYLRTRGLNRLDLVVVTHPDLDHYGGLAWLAAHFPVARVAYPGEDADTRAWIDLKAALAERGIPMIAVSRGESLYRNGAVTLETLGPPPAHFPDRNDNSVVCLLRLPGRRILFTGDVEMPSEDWLMAQPFDDLAGATLKVPHHGSDRTNTQAFFRAVKPPVAVISAGRRNKFGHPGPETVATLEALGARVYLTARDGAILCSGDRMGESWRAFLSAPGKM
jgi:competence protein ComEC